MEKIKIVADSSANLLHLDHTAFAVAPLKVITNEREFVDDEALNVDAMVSWFDAYKGKSKTSCPNPSDWLNAFADGDEIYCVTITSGLSGSYNAACIAKQLYETENPGKQVCVIDSLSAGPELVLIIEKLEELIGKGGSGIVAAEHDRKDNVKTRIMRLDDGKAEADLSQRLIQTGVLQKATLPFFIAM